MDYGDGQTQSYTFDAMGNRLSRGDSASGTTTSAYNAANMLLSTAGAGASVYSSDADGNTLSGGGRTSTWNSQNRLVSCIIGGSTNTYKYGADGLRRQKTANGATTDYAYDGSMMVREGRAAGGILTPATVTATYLIGPQGPAYRRDDTQSEVDSQGRTVTKARWYVYDGLGSVVGEVDPLGNLTSSPKYDVYGAVRANAGAASTRQGFVGGLGHVSDTETGLIYMRARYYDPSMGRFVSQDPACSGRNWFTYCDNNPINEVDQTGRDPVDPQRAMIDAAAACMALKFAWAYLALIGGNAVVAGLALASTDLLYEAAVNIGVAPEVRGIFLATAGFWISELTKASRAEAGAGALVGTAVLALAIIGVTEMLYSETITGH